MGRGDLVPRIITNFSIALQSQAGGGFDSAWPVNLSETGLCVRYKKQLSEKATVHLRIHLSEQVLAFEVLGQVVWVRFDEINKVYYCGIGFTDISPDQVDWIRGYVETGSKTLLDFLSEFPLFEAFSYDDCKDLLRIVTLRELDKKEILYVEGTSDVDLQGLFIVQSGLLSIFKGKTYSREKQLTLVSAGQIFGETTLVTDQLHSATIMAVNAAKLIQINKIGFGLMLQEKPTLALKIMDLVARALAARLGRTTKKLFSPVNF